VSTPVARWLGEDFTCELHEGAGAFVNLARYDPLVVLGLHWTAMAEARWGGLKYRPVTEQQKQAFEGYVASGRPLVAHHGGIAD
jgi:hypothetical protein